MAVGGVNINVDVESLKESMLSDKAPKPIRNSHSKSSARSSMHKISINGSIDSFGSNDEHKQNEFNAPSMNEIESKQRLNEQKARAIRKSLSDRQQQLEKEQNELKRLNEEFRSMEDKLSKDVETLRNLIEGINRDISYYQKDHDWKKKQYEESKMFMDKLNERRDNLTKHLHTIIASNEQLKADRMQKLMAKLENMEIGMDQAKKLNPFGGFDEN